MKGPKFDVRRRYNTSKLPIIIISPFLQECKQNVKFGQEMLWGIYFRTTSTNLYDRSSWFNLINPNRIIFGWKLVIWPIIHREGYLGFFGNLFRLSSFSWSIRLCNTNGCEKGSPENRACQVLVSLDFRNPKFAFVACGILSKDNDIVIWPRQFYITIISQQDLPRKYLVMRV